MTVQILDDLENFWEDFLPFVEERRVVPVIGTDLLTVNVDGVERPLYRVIAERLAEKLRVDVRDLPDPGLNDVVMRFLQARGRREDLYSKLRALVKDMPMEPPVALRQIAGIRDFDLYLTLGFDSMLVDALNADRFAGQPRTEHLAYAPHKVADLPGERAALRNPVVYALFGKASVGPDYVITDEDMLEFLYALQSEARRPHLLFDELQSSHLLFLGCAFPDWLARFFIRIAKSRQLSQQRGESELLVDPRLASETGLVLFLENFSYGTRMLSMEPSIFIAELHRRWIERHPPGAGAGALAAQPVDGEPDLPPGGIFISYAKEDSPAVEQLHDSLLDLGLDVWFDRNRLDAGDQYDLKIRRNIKACSLFIPIVSANTQRRPEGYFRREWKLAEERSWGIADGIPFVVPVVLDDTPPYDSMVPDSFHKAQWMHLPGGTPTAEFQTRLVKLVREHRKREKGIVS